MRQNGHIFTICLAAALLFPLHLKAQNPADSLQNFPLVKQTDLDTLVEYQANRIETDVDARRTVLLGNAEVLYKGMRLTAGKITIDWDDNLLIAEGVPDTSEAADSTRSAGNNGGSSTKLVALPVFEEDGEKMTGEKMYYNFKTRKGRVLRGRTTYEEGYYAGELLKRVSDKVFYVKRGRFTTCDLPHPHYYFLSQKMKMIYQDKVIARPIVMYIHDIPVAALPYGMFPYRKGRHSGILVPRYGQSSVEGRYLRGLGYYWAPSDYWDTKLEVDFYEKSGFMFHSTTNYAIRYLLRGTISGTLVRKHFGGGEKRRRWDISFNHSQTFSPTMRLSAYGAFVSDASYYRDFSANRQQRLNRQIRSNATFSKSWPESKNSLTINLSRTHFLDTDSREETLPQLSFRHGQEALVDLLPWFRHRRKRSGRGKAWYENFYISYSAQLLNRRSLIRSTSTDEFRKTRFFGARHSANLSGSQRIFRYINITQSLSYNETWQDRIKRYYYDPETGQILSEEEAGFWARRIFTSSFSANTKIYGYFPLNRWGIVAFRHVLTPSVGISFMPDFSDPAWGYYQEVADSTGKLYRKDRFAGSAFGGTPSGGQRSISLSVRNIFQMKRLVNGKEVKSDLFSYDLSTFYNFELDSMRLSRLSSSLRASPSRIFNFTMTFSHSFYRYNTATRREVNRLLFLDNPLHPLRLISLSVNASLRLRNTMFQRKKGKQQGKSKAASQDSVAGEPVGQLVQPGRQIASRFEAEESFTPGNIPWNANLSFSYRENHFNPENVQKTFWLNINGSLRLTRNWRISYNARLDLEKKKVIAQDLIIYRDLHCWEARFVWTPTGPYKRYYLRINIKSNLLQDIKLEKRGGRGAFFGYY